MYNKILFDENSGPATLIKILLCVIVKLEKKCFCTIVQICYSFEKSGILQSFFFSCSENVFIVS